VIVLKWREDNSCLGRLFPLPETGNSPQPRVLTLGFVPNRMRPEGTPAGRRIRLTTMDLVERAFGLFEDFG